MEVHLTPEKEARLHQLATHTGKETAQVVEEAVDRLLEYDAHFTAAVEEGRAASHRFGRLTRVAPQTAEIGRLDIRSAQDRQKQGCKYPALSGPL